MNRLGTDHVTHEDTENRRHCDRNVQLGCTWTGIYSEGSCNSFFTRLGAFSKDESTCDGGHMYMSLHSLIELLIPNQTSVCHQIFQFMVGLFLCLDLPQIEYHYMPPLHQFIIKLSTVIVVGLFLYSLSLD